MLYLSGISISLFLGLLLFSKKDKTLADKVLAAWLVVIAFHLFQFYLFISGKIYDYPALLGLGMPVPLLHGPFLFLYVATLTGRLLAIRRKDLLHFLPAVLAYLYMIEFFLRPAEEKIFVFRNRGVGYETFVFVNVWAIIFSGVGYVTWSLILLNKHRRSILDQFSSTEKINLLWLQYLIYGIAVIWVFVILSMDTYVFSTAVLFVVFIGYFGIRQVGIFSRIPEPTDPPTPEGGGWNSHSPPPRRIGGSEKAGYLGVNQEGIFSKSSISQQGIEQNPNSPPSRLADTPEPPKKYSKSGLTEESATQIHQKLSDPMSSEKLFLESEISLATLAARLNTAPNYLSQVINEREGKNFYDYINTLRIEEFKKVALKRDNQRFTLLAMAYDCGFSSKSSFNKYFRKVTGTSPMEYLKQEEVLT